MNKLTKDEQLAILWSATPEARPFIDLGLETSRNLSAGRNAGANKNKQNAEARRELLRDFRQGYIRGRPGASVAQPWREAKRSQSAEVRKAATAYNTVKGVYRALPGLKGSIE